MTFWTAGDFETYRENYGVMLDVLYQNPVISNILNNVARPSQLDGYAKVMIDALKDNVPLLMQNFVSLIESEFVFVATHREPFIFLRERSRIAARATGDYVNELMKPVVVKYFRDLVDGCYILKLRNSLNVEEMLALNNRILHIAFSDAFVKDIPLQVKFIVSEIFKQASRYGFGKFNYMLTGNMLILRCLCPMISVPEYYGVCSPSKGAPSQMARKSLILQGKLLSNIANFSQNMEFELDEQMILYKTQITKQSKRYLSWIDKVMKVTQPQYKTTYFSSHDSNFQPFVTESSDDLLEGCYTVIPKQEPLSYKVDPDFEVSDFVPVTVEPAPPPKPKNIQKQTTINDLIKQRSKGLSQVQLNSQKYPLQYLSCIHRALKEHKQQIYDVIQAMFTKKQEFTSQFAQEAQMQKFGRTIKAYAELSTINSTQILNTLNQLLQIIQNPPPADLEINYVPIDEQSASTRYYPVYEIQNGKSNKRMIIFTQQSLLVLEGDLYNKKQKILFKRQISGRSISKIDIQPKTPSLTLIINKEQIEYVCENTVVRDQLLAEVFDACYYQADRQLIFQGRQNEQNLLLILSKDSLIKLQDEKILGIYHFWKFQYEIESEILRLKYFESQKSEEILMDENEIKLFDAKCIQLNRMYCLLDDEPDVDALL
ncbi:Conserved_hypothetical protein [Hexamita inflata]|uniref:Ras-GAP domain-containing protein n=1 Tax=Hexamita inflata TaxID=28002 RepID=A0AA86R240_9EUKA|nr:Conserved hypothetical protein [Hexamita inflata]